MAYNTKWFPEQPELCQKLAEEKARRVSGLLDIEGVRYLYRFEDVLYSVCIDPDSDYYSTRLDIELQAFTVLKWTKCGATLHMRSGARNKFVNLNAVKRFACLTVAEAKFSFIERKRRQAQIYRAKAATADKAIEMVDGCLRSGPKY